MSRDPPPVSSPPIYPETPLLLRMPKVVWITGLGRSTIYRLMAARKFPSPIHLGPRTVAWRRSDLDEWTKSQPVSPQ